MLLTVFRSSRACNELSLFQMWTVKLAIVAEVENALMGVYSVMICTTAMMDLTNLTAVSRVLIACSSFLDFN